MIDDGNTIRYKGWLRISILMEKKRGAARLYTGDLWEREILVISFYLRGPTWPNIYTAKQKTYKRINGEAKYQEFKQQKYDHQLMALGWVGKFARSHSLLSLAHSTYTLTVKTEIYINHNKDLLLSFHRVPHISILFHVYPHFPHTHSLANKGKIKTPTVRSLRASDSFTLPSRSSALWWMYGSKAHS